MNLISLDLEMNQPSGSIVQIGAAVGNLQSGAILDSFSCYIAVDEPVAPEIVDLTGITADYLSTNGVELTRGYELLVDFCTQFAPFINPVTWGGDDASYLRERLPRGLGNWPFGRRCIDVKTLHTVSALFANSSPKGGLERTMRRYGLKFEGRAHDARIDALNTLTLLFEIKRRAENNLPAFGPSPA